MFRILNLICLTLLALSSFGWATVISPVPELPAGIETLSTKYANIRVFADDEIGPMPRPHSDVSQGAETGDPNYYIQMSDMLGEMGGRLVRCDPLSDDSKVKVVEGKVVIDFSSADAICDALEKAGAKPVWNIASFPDEMLDGDRPIADLLDQYVYQVTHHWNVEQKRGIRYFEYWNEPGGLDGPMFAVAVKAAHRADPTVKVGGPAIMGCSIEVLENAVKYCLENDVDLGFVSFHLYYEMPEGFLQHIENVEQMLAKYPRFKDLELLITEWGVDAGLSGSCDTLFNAAYYSSVMHTMMHKWPRVRPMHFEFRDGWDAIGPSRDLWGRWGMVTYPHLLPKPVYNAGLMWNELASDRVKAESTDPGIRVIATKNDHRMAILIWSWPKEYERLLADSPKMRVSPLDTPVRLRVEGIPFASQGIRYRRFVVDQTHSNLAFDPYSANLQKVHDIILARTEPERGQDPEKGVPGSDFECDLILPLHSVTLIELLPEERPPVNVVAECDRFCVWAGEKATVTIEPKFDEEIQLDLIGDPASRRQWKITQISDNPLRLHLEAPPSDVKSMRYFNVWVKNKNSRAIGQAVLELQTDTPALLSREPDHVDVSPVTRTGPVTIDVNNKTPDVRKVIVEWLAPQGVTVTPKVSEVELTSGGTAPVTAVVSFAPGLDPRRYHLTARLSAGCELGEMQVPVHLSLQSPRAKGAITVDGDLSEWESGPSVRVGSNTDFDGHSYREWGGDEDISGRIWTQWDDENLYLAFRVQDDEHVQKISTWEMKNFDSVHLGFDLRRDSTNPYEFFDESDGDYVLGYWGTTAYAYRHWGAKRPMDFADGVTIAAKKQGNIITYEVAMNWKKEFLPYAEPRVGEIIGLSVYFRDYDEGKSRGEMRWGRGLAWDEKRPALFNSVWLGE